MYTALLRLLITVYSVGASMMTKAFLQPDCLDMVLASAVEVCPRETNGILLGRTRRLNGRQVLELRTAYPIQTAERTPTAVGHGNLQAVHRLTDALNVMGKGLAGGYHSHPYPGGHISLTKYDIRFIEEELKRLRLYTGYRKMDSWFELVMSVRPVSYTKLPKVGRRVEMDKGALVVKLRTEKYRGFDVKLRGYQVTKSEGKMNKRVMKLISPSG